MVQTQTWSPPGGPVAQTQTWSPPGGPYPDLITTRWSIPRLDHRQVVHTQTGSLPGGPYPDWITARWSIPRLDHCQVAQTQTWSPPGRPDPDLITIRWSRPRLDHQQRQQLTSSPDPGIMYCICSGRAWQTLHAFVRSSLVRWSWHQVLWTCQLWMAPSYLLLQNGQCFILISGCNPVTLCMQIQS